MSGATSSKSPTDRREWRQRPMAERIAYANKLLVLHPRFREAVALLDRCHQSSKQAGEPVCGAILGSSGVGKTSVVDHYRRLHAPRETDTASESCAAELSNAPPQPRVRTAWGGRAAATPNCRSVQNRRGEGEIRRGESAEKWMAEKWGNRPAPG